MDEQISIFDFPEFLPDNGRRFKPCECGYSENMMIMTTRMGTEKNSKTAYRVVCPVCGRVGTDRTSKGSMADSEEQAVEKWNINPRCLYGKKKTISENYTG